MASVAEIERAIEQLTSEQLRELRLWFAEREATAWDRQFEADVAAGRLDRFADEALAEWRDGKTTEL